MWPWEHLAFGYVLFSVWVRVRGTYTVGDVSVAAMAFGTQLPDLVDKPGAWLFGVLPSGISLAHSVLVAVPVATIAVVAGYRLGWPQAGVGFAIGYLSHLAGDVIWALSFSGGVPNLLWPLVPVEPDSGPFVGRVLEELDGTLEILATQNGVFYLGVEFSFLVFAVALWRFDGYPGVGLFRSKKRVDVRSS